MRRFFAVYLRRELRRRRRQAALTAVGLGAGVGLVMTVSAASAGAADAQAAALRSLTGIGATLTVTAPDRQPGALRDPGALLTGRLGPMPSAARDAIGRLPGVAAAAGGLRLTVLRQSAGGLWTDVTIDGADTGRAGLGPLSAATVVSGRTFRPGDADVVLAGSGYATASRLRVGSFVSLAGARLTVIGIVRGGAGDLYLPLDTAQRLAHLPHQVNVIYVAAADAGRIPQVRREIGRLLPAATVIGSSDLASAVSGSLRSAGALIGDLGRWTAAAALAAAVAAAGLLTLAAVGRRAREFGTLKALGWTTRRVIGQVLAEAMVTGGAGAILGVAAGYAGAGLIDGLGPVLSATVPASDGHGEAVLVRLAAHASPAVAGLAVLLAVGGGLLAGGLGAWRAARMRPADAFTQVT